MKLVIDIPEEMYKNLQKRSIEIQVEGYLLENLVLNGTPLPKRMLSVDLIIETLCPKDEDYNYPCIAPSYLEEELERLLLDDAPTIIEADTENKDKE